MFLSTPYLSPRVPHGSASILATCLIASSWIIAPVMAAPPASLADGGPASKRVLATLEQSANRFTPELRTDFLCFRKQQAVAELSTHKITLPDDFLGWIDSQAAAASTVYGIRHGTPAQALLILRSLELDLGREKFRKHLPLALAAAVHDAASVPLDDPEAKGYSLKPRNPMVVKIPANPLVRANTRPTGRPLDVNDHIINFLETEETVTRDAAGHETVVVKEREKPILAHEVVTSRGLQEQFNAYMAAKGHPMNLNCGDKELHWGYTGVSWRQPHRKGMAEAWKIFFGAYTAKGRLPADRDPMPDRTTWIVYQVANAGSRAVNLDMDWPIAMYLVRNMLPLREAEFVWEEQRTGKRPMRYIEYVNQIAQDVEALRLRRLTPFDFGYGSYPMMRKDGGVCGTHTATAMTAGAALGYCMFNCSSPGHSFPVQIAKSANGYNWPGGHTGVPWFFGPGAPEGIGSDNLKLHSLCWAMNSDPQAFYDSQLAWTLAMSLPQSAGTENRTRLLGSAALLCPYNVSLLRALVPMLKDPLPLSSFWENWSTAVAAANKGRKGLPDGGGALANETWNAICKNLAAAPPPDDKALVARINTLLTRRDGPPDLRIRYQLAAEGPRAVLASTSDRLAAHVTQPRNPALCDTMAVWIKAAATAIPDPDQRKAWAMAEFRKIHGSGLYLLQKGKAHEVQPDKAVKQLAELAGVATDPDADICGLMDQMTAILKTHIAGKRDTPGCQNQAARFRAGIAAAKKAGLDLKPWAATWFGIMKGKQVYGPHSWTQKDAVSVVLDELIAEYPASAPVTPSAAAPADATGKPATLDELRAELDSLNQNTADGTNQKRINELNRMIDALERK